MSIGEVKFILVFFIWHMKKRIPVKSIKLGICFSVNCVKCPFSRVLVSRIGLAPCFVRQSANLSEEGIHESYDNNSPSAKISLMIDKSTRRQCS